MSTSRPHSPPWSARDLDELADIMNEYEPRLTQLLKQKFPSIDHGDVVGQALLELTQNWHYLTKNRRAWLTDCAKKRAIDATRKAKHDGGSLDDPKLATLRLTRADEDEYATVLVYRAIAALPQHQRNALTLRMFGLTVAEIADSLNRSPRTIEDLITQARNNVRAALSGTRHDSEGTS